jgi:hypothetical protein
LAGDPLHQKIYVPLRPAQRQQFSPHNLRVEAQIQARLVECEQAARALKCPPVGGHLPSQNLPLLTGGGDHLAVPQPPMAEAQFTNVVLGPNENLSAKPFPSSLALFNDVLVVVVHYGDGNHYFVGASQ